MSDNDTSLTIDVNFSSDGNLNFSLESFRQVTREQRMDRIVSSVSNQFSQKLAAIIAEEKQAKPQSKTSTKKPPSIKKKQRTKKA